MTKTVELIFDFVSPNAYLIWRPLRQVVADGGAQLVVTPVFLGGMHKLTGNAPPMIRDAEIKGKNAYGMLEMNRFIQKHGLTDFRMNPKFPFNSVTVQRLLLTVEGQERAKLVDTLLAAIWEEGIDPTDPAAVGKALGAAGFDAKPLLERTQEAGVKQALMDNTQGAVDRGAFGIPTMYVDTGSGAEMYFGKERLGQIAEQLAG